MDVHLEMAYKSKYICVGKLNAIDKAIEGLQAERRIIDKRYMGYCDEVDVIIQRVVREGGDGG